MTEEFSILAVTPDMYLYDLPHLLNWTSIYMSNFAWVKEEEIHYMPSVLVSVPTASAESILAVLILIATESILMMKGDVGGAYLNADMEKEMIMILCEELTKLVIEVLPEMT